MRTSICLVGERKLLSFSEGTPKDGNRSHLPEKIENGTREQRTGMSVGDGGGGMRNESLGLRRTEQCQGIRNER